MTTVLSDRLICLLYESKRSYGKNKSSKEIVNQALGDLYHRDMPVKVMIMHCLHACLEICKTPEFEKTSDSKIIELITNLLTSPYDYFINHNSKSLYPKMDDVVSFEHIYDSYLSELISFILLTNIGWSDQYKEYCKLKESKS